MAKEKRFITVYKEGTIGEGYKVIVDKETGVNYMMVVSGYGGGLTPLLDREGKPIITTVER